MLYWFPVLELAKHAHSALKREEPPNWAAIMLTSGLDHVAVITNDSDRLQSFYIDMFGATVESGGEEFPGGPRMTVINIGPATELNVFEIEGNEQADCQTPMFGRGRLDHIGLCGLSVCDGFADQWAL